MHDGNLDALREALNETAYGGSICFLGAGFSLSGFDRHGRPIPSTTDLEREIRTLAGLVKEDGSKLSDLADYCEADANLSIRLKDLLIDRLTYCAPSEMHRAILGLPWRAIFTTNFDDLPEQSLSTRKFSHISPRNDLSALEAGRLPIYYLHGRARDLCDGGNDPRIVISERNYLTLKEKNQNMYSALENEVYAATRVFFVGYSLRDAEIASRLFSIENLHEKSIVITGPAASIVETTRLKKFGKVYPIGVDEFSNKIPAADVLSNLASKPASFQFIKRISLPSAVAEVKIEDVDRLLLSGEFSLAAFAAQQRASVVIPEYSIFRKRAVEEIFSSAALGSNRVIISSDLGNGKSTVLQQAMHEASVKGYEVYLIESLLPESFTEVDRAISFPGRKIFVVDGLVRNAKLIKYVSARLPANCILLVADRVSSEELIDADIFDQSKYKVRDIDLNILNEEELTDWNNFLERWGFWQERIEDSEQARISFLRNECNRENRSIVLSLFKGARLSQRIADIVEFFITRNPTHSKAFVAVLINSLCQKHVSWDRIVDWVGIDQTSFRSAVLRSPVADFMSGKRDWYNFTSTQLADFIFGNFDFLVDDIVDVYTKIVRETAYSANDPRSGFDSKENLKELMRFRFLTRLMMRRSDASTAISAVYHRLSNVPRIRENDQFWLQYAMARMEVNDLDWAETYLNTAEGLANKKGLDYSKVQLADQRVRLYFRKNVVKSRPVNGKEIRRALADLLPTLNGPKEHVVHPLRSAEHILTFLEARADDIAPDLVSEIIDVVDLMRSILPAGKLQKSQRGETERIRRQVKDCKLILSNI